MWGGNYHAVDKRLTRYKCSVLCTLQTCIRTEASPTKRKENAEWSQLASGSFIYKHELLTIIFTILHSSVYKLIWSGICN